MSITRRDFLASGLLAGAAGIVVPPVLARGVLAAANDGVHNNRVLVVVQLGGGNDGLNTVVPYADAAYHDARPGIGVAVDKVLHLDAAAGLNPVMTGMKALYDAGRLAVVQGVGYNNPTYSHFEALHVWEYADPQRRATDGWLGRLLATQMKDASNPLAACALGQTGTPTELRASGATVSVISSVKGYDVQGGAVRQAAAPALYRRTPGVYGALFDQALSTAETGIGALKKASTYSPAVAYGSTATVYGSKNSLADALQMTAQMIVTQPAVKICHVVLGGFDTHQQEDQRQAALLTNVDMAISSFMKDLDAHGVADRVVLMTWSEFGRRVKENGSRGTDHGSAAPVFVVGAPVKGGMYGAAPSLTDLDSGNLKHTTDFRSVYQAVIQDWLGGDASSVLGASFPQLSLLRA
ncbi:MAG TPA: DUF1501 domain-containing protein [Candidatus Dormibacteraeota bacterium]|jgi:uncharacterized protein (DUF1501 family)|nr:DUF1501 domain-containing protein [Candidatus Dormibacteraeota bacterium]